MTATAKLDRLLITKAVLKEVIAELEGSFGVEEALPVTLAVLEAIDAADRMAERVNGGAPCPVCNGDGWYASPSWADEEKKLIRVTKVACPRGCPWKPEEQDSQ